MHSPDETVDEEDVAPQQLSLIKMSSEADSRDDMLNKCRRRVCNLTIVAMLLLCANYLHYCSPRKVTPDHKQILVSFVKHKKYLQYEILKKNPKQLHKEDLPMYQYWRFNCICQISIHLMGNICKMKPCHSHTQR